jgi:hypothetical protein
MVDKIVTVNEFYPGKGANAIKVNSNFNDVVLKTNEIIDELAVMQGEIEGTTGDIAKIVSAIYIGQIVPLCRSSLPAGVLPCNGSEYSRNLFPSFFRDYLITGKILTCSYDAYANDIAEFGYCGKFALDGIKNTFKTPTISSGVFLGGTSSSSEYGKAYKQGLPNITGSIDNIQTCEYTAPPVSGAFSISNQRQDGYSNKQELSLTINFDASKVNGIYGASANVTPKNIKYPYGVVVANISETLSEINWNAFLVEIEKKVDKPTIVEDTTSTDPTIALLGSNQIYRYTQALDSLTITDYEVSDISSTIWFTTSADFTGVTFTEAPVGFMTSLPDFEASETYVVTMNNGYVIIGKVATE